MLLTKAIEKVESSNVFKEFKDENPDFKLAHAFTIIDKIQQNWQIGYYSITKDKVVVFDVGKEVQKNPEEEVFKKPDHKVKTLDLKKINIDLEKAVNIAEDIIKDKYPAEMISKTIVIIQNLETELYNLTLVSHTLNIINIKIDAKTGKVLSEARQSIMGLRKE